MREAPEAPVLTQERLRSLEGRDPMAAALLSVVSSLPPSEDAPDPEAGAAMENVATARKVYSVFSTVFLLLLLLVVAVGCPAACFG